jgi:hypothetical protein
MITGSNSKDLTLCRAKVEEFQIGENKYESLCDDTITTIKKREKQLIDGITKHSQTGELFLWVQICVRCV